MDHVQFGGLRYLLSISCPPICCCSSNGRTRAPRVQKVQTVLRVLGERHDILAREEIGSSVMHCGDRGTV